MKKYIACQLIGNCQAMNQLNLVYALELFHEVLNRTEAACFIDLSIAWHRQPCTMVKSKNLFTLLIQSVCRSGELTP